MSTEVPPDGICHKHLIMGCSMCSSPTPQNNDWSKSLQPQQNTDKDRYKGVLGPEAAPQNDEQQTIVNRIDELIGTGYATDIADYFTELLTAEQKKLLERILEKKRWVESPISEVVPVEVIQAELEKLS